jgi:hypothetical protein
MSPPHSSLQHRLICCSPSYSQRVPRAVFQPSVERGKGVVLDDCQAFLGKGLGEEEGGGLKNDGEFCRLLVWSLTGVEELK